MIILDSSNRHKRNYLGTKIEEKWWKMNRKGKSIAKASGEYCYGKKYLKAILALILVLTIQLTICCQDNALSAPINNKQEKEILNAIFTGQTDIIRNLLNSGFDINHQFKNHNTLLHEAIYKKKPQIVSMLLDKNANPNIQDKKGRTPIHVAIFTWQEEITEMLAIHGAKYDLPDDEGKIPLIEAAKWEKNQNILEKFLKQGANIEGTDKRGYTMLHMAVLFRALKNIEFLLQNGANIEARDSIGGTPIRTATGMGPYGGEKIAILLIKAGADVNTQDDFGWTPLHGVVFNGHPNMAKMLLQNGADPSIKSTRKRGALTISIPKQVVKAGTSPIELSRIMKWDKMAAMLENPENSQNYYRGATISGKVYDIMTGLPIGKARIRCPTALKKVLTVITDEKGEYLLRDFQPGSPQNFCVDHPEYHTFCESLFLKTDHAFEWDFALMHKNDRTKFKGRVIDALTLKPIEGVTFTNGITSKTVSSDSKGEFVFDEVTYGSPPLTMRFPQRQKNYQEHFFTLNEIPFIAEIYVPCTYAASISLAPNSQLEIVDLNTGRPITDARVRLVELDKNYYSDDKGVIYLEGLPTKKRLTAVLTSPNSKGFCQVLNIMDNGDTLHKLYGRFKVY